MQQWVCSDNEEAPENSWPSASASLGERVFQDTSVVLPPSPGLELLAD